MEIEVFASHMQLSCKSLIDEDGRRKQFDQTSSHLHLGVSKDHGKHILVVGDGTDADQIMSPNDVVRDQCRGHDIPQVTRYLVGVQ